MERKGELKDAIIELDEMTPLPMNTMLEKQSRAEAIKKRDERQIMTVKDVPATGTVTGTFENRNGKKRFSN